MQLLGLHAGSVEFYVRTLVDPFFPEDVMPLALDAGMDDKYWEIMRDLKQMGFYFQTFEEPTRIFDMLFSREVRQLDGPVIDGLPLSEKRKLKPPVDDQDHYLDWLAKSDLLKAIREETIDLDADQGMPLLYLLLRHAIVREYFDSACVLLKAAGIISPVAHVDQERDPVGLQGHHDQRRLGDRR